MQIKQTILEEVEKMLLLGKRPDEITIREITKKLNISVSTINYHFENKENLMQLALEHMVLEIRTALMQHALENKDAPPRHQLMMLTKSMGDLLVQYETAATQVLLFDLEKTGLRDSLGLLEVYMPIMLSVTEENLASTYCMMLLFTLQSIFLKREGLKAEGVLDFYDKSQRDKTIDDMFVLLRGLRSTTPA